MYSSPSTKGVIPVSADEYTEGNVWPNPTTADKTQKAAIIDFIAVVSREVVKSLDQD